MELEELLAATADQAPCGPNLEYDAAFLELEQLVQGKPEQQFGATVIPAEEPQWADVREAAERLFSRTKDLRAAMHLLRAQVNLDGLSGLNAGLSLLLQLLERYWDCVHPQLDPEEGDDPTMRLNALAPLTDAGTLLRDLRRCPFPGLRAIGNLQVRDVEIALGRLPPAPDRAALSMEQLQAAFRDAASDDASALEGVVEAARTVRTLHAKLVERLGADRAPDLGPLAGVLDPLANLCRGALAAIVASRQSPAVAESGVDAAGVATGVAASSGEVRNRDDVIRLLDKLCDFLERQEPSNPAPLLLRRAKRLMTMNFIDIIKDMAPESVSQVRNIAGIAEQ